MNAELHGKPGDTVTFRLALFNGLREGEVFEYAAYALDEDFDCVVRAPAGPVAVDQTVQIECDVKIPPRDVEAGEYGFRVAAVLQRDNTIGVAQDCYVIVEVPAPAFVPPPPVVAAPPPPPVAAATPPPIAASPPPRIPATSPRAAAPPPRVAASEPPPPPPRRPAALEPIDEQRPILAMVAGVIVALVLVVGIVFLLYGGGSDPSTNVLGETQTPKPTVRSSTTPTAAATPTAAPTATLGATEAPTDVPTDVPTDEPTAEPTDITSPGNDAPVVSITTPADGQLFCPKTSSGGVYTVEIPLQADASDEEDGFLPNESLSWSFSLDGGPSEVFANSAIVSLELHVSATQSESVGVTIDATDSDGLSSGDTIALTVGGPQSTACS
ncbi:MAG: hypothetical protein ABI559_05880 [Chloroflexota bacterium]